MLRCQPFRFQQLQHSEKNSTESRLFVVVDHTWILGVALASFLLTVASNVSMFFCTCSSSFAAKGEKWADCWSRVRHIQSAHDKNKMYRKHLHSDKAHSENVTHSNEERNTARGSVAPSSKTQHTTFTMSSPLTSSCTAFNANSPLRRKIISL